jgi:hypothetical protein
VFVRADALAEHYSHNYRSAYVLAYLLSAAAVFIALGSTVVKNPDFSSKLKFAAVELVIIMFIISVVFVGQFFHWHQRWLDYRTL